MTKYWIFNVRDDRNDQFSRKGIEIYEHNMKDGFWGLRGTVKDGKKAANVSRLRKGDKVVFYLVGSGGQCFLGTCVIDSAFRSLTLKEISVIVHKEYLDWNQGVFISDIDQWKNPLPIKQLRGKISVVPKGKNYGSYLQGSVKSISKQDYITIISEHERAP
jgi:hypothetical protein